MGEILIDSKELQKIRTKSNLYKKALGKIFFDIEHLKKGSYDYGEAAERLLYEIKDSICEVENKIKELK